MGWRNAVEPHWVCALDRDLEDAAASIRFIAYWTGVEPRAKQRTHLTRGAEITLHGSVYAAKEMELQRIAHTRGY